MRIAALLTCHNRKAKTLACLESLFSLAPEVEVFLTDDGCTDGTREEVQKLFPKVTIIQGNGNLYWNRGMHAAWSEALKTKFDYYLWLNDDVVLYPNFLKELLECSSCGTSIVSGIVEDFNHSRVIYGGYDARKCMVEPSGYPQKIQWMNGNVVLVPSCVVEKIGILDPFFIHDLGDVDYGMRAIENGFSVVSTRVSIAAGYPNDVCRVRKWNSNLLDRFKRLKSPLGSPLDKNFYFRQRHFGYLHAIAYNIKIVILNLLPDSIVKKIWGDFYIEK